MTYEEAIDILVNKIHIDVRFVNDDEFKAMTECLYKCKDALEKQLPKKPKYKIRVSMVQGFLLEDIDVLCPSCNKRIDSIVDGKSVVGKKQRHCDNCGQRLDWRNWKKKMQKQ